MSAWRFFFPFPPARIFVLCVYTLYTQQTHFFLLPSLFLRVTNSMPAFFFILHVHSFPSLCSLNPSFPMHLVTFTHPPPYFSHYSRRRCMSLFHIYNRPLHPTCPSPTSTRMATLFLQPTYLFSLKIH